MKRVFKKNDGFTLIEMLVATSVSSIILLMIYTAYSSIIRTVNYSQKMTSYYEELNLVLRQIHYDLTNIYWKKDKKNLIFKSEIRNSSSVINFITSSHKNIRIIQGIKTPNAISDIHEVSYFLQQDKESDNYNLIRRRDLHYDENPTEGGESAVIMDDVKSLKFEFQYRSDWTDSWDSANVNKIPLSVKTSITVIDPFGKTDDYSFITLPGISNE